MHERQQTVRHGIQHALAAGERHPYSPLDVTPPRRGHDLTRKLRAHFAEMSLAGRHRELTPVQARARLQRHIEAQGTHDLRR